MDKIQKQILELVRKASVPDPVHYADYAVEELAMETLNNFIKDCSYCGECCGGTKSFVGGNPHGAIMIIGDRVLRSQTDKDTVFPLSDTPEGQMMNEVLDELHVNKNQLIWMNVVNCFTHKKLNDEILERSPTSAEIENCQTYIDYAIDAFKPLYILTLGNIALNVFKSGVIKKDRGEWFVLRDKIPVMPTYSPSYLRQMEEIKDEFAEDYKKEFFEDIQELFSLAMDDHPDSDIIFKVK